MHGYIYVLINPSLDGLLKIGKTTRTPEERARELSASTGVPTPFLVGYSCYVSDCSQAEAHIHQLLSLKGFRLSENREFFRAKLDQVVRYFLECEAMFPANPDEEEKENWEHSESASALIDALLAESNDCIGGENGSFIDHEEAQKKLQQAHKLGSVKALFHMGKLYSNRDSPLYDAKKALSLFKEALNQGCHPDDCYFQIGKAYALSGDNKNASIAFSKVFNSEDLIHLLDKQTNDFIGCSAQEIEDCNSTLETYLANFMAYMALAGQNLSETIQTTDPVQQLLFKASQYFVDQVENHPEVLGLCIPSFFHHFQEVEQNVNALIKQLRQDPSLQENLEVMLGYRQSIRGMRDLYESLI